MRMLGMVTCSLLLAASPGAPRAHSGSDAKAIRTVKRFVQGFLDWYVPEALEDHKVPASDLALKHKQSAFSPALFRALKADSEAEAKDTSGFIVGLDFDPFLNAQDPCDHYKVGAVTHQRHRYLVEIHGYGGCADHRGPRVIAEVARRKGRWVFTNFHYPASGDVPRPDLLSTLRLLREDRRKPSRRGLHR
jgi:hypothetical protein